MKYSKKSFLTIFKINEFDQIIDDSVETINSFEQIDQEYKSGEYESLRINQQEILTKLYIILYLEKYSEEDNLSNIVDYFTNQFKNKFKERLEHFQNNVDFLDNTQWKISELYLLFVNYKNFVRSFKKYLKRMKNIRSYNANIKTEIGKQIQNCIQSVDYFIIKLKALSDKLETIDDEQIINFLWSLSRKTGKEAKHKRTKKREELKENVSKIKKFEETKSKANDSSEMELKSKDLNKNYKENKTKEADFEDPLTTNFKRKMTKKEMIERKTRLSKKFTKIKTSNIISTIHNIKLIDQREDDSSVYGKIWGAFTNSISTSGKAKDILAQEQNK